MFFHIFLSVRQWRSRRSYQTSSDSVSKIISNSLFLILSIISTVFAVCIPKEIHNISIFLFRALILESVLGAEASFKSVILPFDSPLLRTFLKDSSLATLFLRTKKVMIPYFVPNFLLDLLAYMESEITHLTFTFISFCSCGYSPSGVYPHWKPWRRYVRWTICRYL